MRREGSRSRSRRLDRAPIPIAQRAWTVVHRSNAAAVETDRVINRRGGRVEVVCRHDDDRAVAAKRAKPLEKQRRGFLVEACERLIEKRETRGMEQRALECQPLSHAPRIRSNPIVGAFLEPRVTERGGDARVAIRQSIQPPIKLKVFSRRKVVVEKLVVAEHADARTQAVAT